MKKQNKIVSSIILAAFLLNSVVADIVIAQGDTLAVPSMLNDLVGIEHKDMGCIEVALSAQLVKARAMGATQANYLTFMKSLDDIRIKGRTIFNPADMQFFFKEARLTPNGAYTMCRITDGKDPRTYHITYFMPQNPGDGFPMQIYTDKEWKRFSVTDEIFTKATPLRIGEDAEAIRRYIEDNEKIVDPFIEKQIKSGNFAEITGRAQELGWDNSYPDRVKPKAYCSEHLWYRIKARLAYVLHVLNVDLETAVSGKNIVFIKVPDIMSYPMVTVTDSKYGTRRIRVTSHTSQNAVYFFVKADLFERLIDNDDDHLSELADGKGDSEGKFHELLSDIIHETGVAYNLPFEIGPDGVSNDLDLARGWCSGSKSRDEIFKRFPSLKNPKVANLDENLAGRDYMAGDAEETVPTPETRCIDLAQLIAANVRKGKDEKLDVQFATALLKQVDALLKEYIDKVIAYLILNAGTPVVNMTKFAEMKAIAIRPSGESSTQKFDLIKDELDTAIGKLTIDIIQTVRQDGKAKIREMLLNPEVLRELLANDADFRQKTMRTFAENDLGAIRDDALSRYFDQAIYTREFLALVVGKENVPPAGAQTDTAHSRAETGQVKEKPGKSPADALVVIASDSVLQSNMFDSEMYLKSYELRCEAFGFEAPAPGKTLGDEESALRTVRRDLHEMDNSLARRGILETLQQNDSGEWTIVPVDGLKAGKKIMYRLSAKGKNMLAALGAIMHSAELMWKWFTEIDFNYVAPWPANAEGYTPRVNKTLKFLLEEGYLVNDRKYHVTQLTIDMAAKLTTKVKSPAESGGASFEEREAKIDSIMADLKVMKPELAQSGFSLEGIFAILNVALSSDAWPFVNKKLIAAFDRIAEVFKTHGLVFNDEKYNWVYVRDRLLGVVESRMSMVDEPGARLLYISSSHDRNLHLHAGEGYAIAWLASIITAEERHEASKISMAQGRMSAGDFLRRIMLADVYFSKPQTREMVSDYTVTGIIERYLALLPSYIETGNISDWQYEVMVFAASRGFNPFNEDNMKELHDAVSEIEYTDENLDFIKMMLREYEALSSQVRVVVEMNGPDQGLSSLGMEHGRLAETLGKYLMKIQSVMTDTKLPDRTGGDQGSTGPSASLSAGTDALPKAVLRQLGITRDNIIRIEPSRTGKYKTIGASTNTDRVSVLTLDNKVLIKNHDATYGFRYTPNDRCILFIDYNGGADVYDLEHPETPILENKDASGGIEFSNQEIVFTGRLSGIITAYELPTGKSISKVAEVNSKATEIVETAEIDAAITLAPQAGLEIPTHPDTRYTLLMTEQFFANGDFAKDQARYGDRFNLDRVSGQTSTKFVDNILAKAKGIENRTIALVPDDLPETELQRFIVAGVRFIRTDVGVLLKARAEKDAYREKFQLDTYVMMLLTRRIDRDIAKDSGLYQTLSFYIRSHFGFTEVVAVDDYILAIVNNELAKLIKGYLTYRPAKAYDAPKYEQVAAALIAA
jgi:hypothetical protein